MTKLLGISGRRYSGKSTIGKYLTDKYQNDHYPPFSGAGLRLNWHIAVKCYNFADSLKQLCIDYLGVPKELAYGSNADKDAIMPHLLWENLPLEDITKSGAMTIRETLQIWGSEIFRKAYPDIWTNKCLAQIFAEQPEFAAINDVRFINEVEAIKNRGGKILRLTRKLFPNDVHVSETALDDYDGFDYIVDNQNQTLQETLTECENKILYGDW